MHPFFIVFQYFMIFSHSLLASLIMVRGYLLVQLFLVGKSAFAWLTFSLIPLSFSCGLTAVNRCGCLFTDLA